MLDLWFASDGNVLEAIRLATASSSASTANSTTTLRLPLLLPTLCYVFGHEVAQWHVMRPLETLSNEEKKKEGNTESLSSSYESSSISQSRRVLVLPFLETKMIEQIYAISLPQGPLGLTLENILERTIVVSIKPQGLASQAGVEPYIWLVGING